MRPNRFLFIIAHPTHGRIKRFHVRPRTLLALGSAALLATISAIGFGAHYIRQSAENDRLVAENSALQSEYDSLLLTVDERAQQLESLGNLAYQISIAYGIPRDEIETDAAYSAEMEVAYYASLGQYGQLRTVLSESVSGIRSSEMLANGKPSIWPAKGHLSSGYGTRQDPFHGKGTFHPGIDISAPRGTPVVATADGFVTFASWERGLGHCVKIRHGRQGYRTIYGHLNEYFVREGQFVSRGEVIGRVGSSGRTTGNHVHYEVHHNNLRMNPYKYLRSRDRTYEVSLAD